MVHLPIHLADEAALARPYLQTLKRYVRNKGHPEGSIAKAYLVDECLSFCSMYLRDVESRRTRRSRNEEGIERGVSDGLSIFDSKGCYMGSRENVELDLNVLDQCHKYILNNCDKVSLFRRQHEEFLKTKHRRERLTMRQIKELSKKEFPEWFKQHMNSRCHANDTLISQDLHWLANYPNMFEVKYCGPTEAGDRGRAVIESPRGMKTDQYGFTMVNFNQLGFKADPFILASQALQAFYVEDTIENDWHVVVRTDAIDDYAIPNLNDRILDDENFHTRVGVEETHFLESFPLPAELVNQVNADDELTDDDRE
ncbi:unnamed protein product [Malus baccata var. baccata]